jgi:molybdenum cofactor biosynthesis enzyme MoaA
VYGGVEDKIMKIETFTAVVGNKACNATCPYCVSKMTPGCEIDKAHVPNLRNFRIACRLAREAGATTLLFTGKGEPTLFAKQISMYMGLQATQEFPLIELQTNGIIIEEKYDEYIAHLRDWYDLGMTTVSLSIAHFSPQENVKIFTNGEMKYNPWEVVNILHEVGFSVRINCVLMHGYVQHPSDVEALMDMCNVFDVEQTTVRSITRPDKSESPEVAKWVDEHRIDGIEQRLMAYLENDGAFRLLELPHGAVVYDWRGQNICVNNCLTSSKDPENIRQLIYFPDGKLRYDWKYKGAIIL